MAFAASVARTTPRSAISQMFMVSSSGALRHTGRLVASHSFLATRHRLALSTLSSQGKCPRLPSPHRLAQSTFVPAAFRTVRTFSTSSTLFGRRYTYNAITHMKRKRRNGFLARLRSRTGRKILERRRLKGRRNLSH